MIYTYIHKRLDGKVFYVGAGSKTRPYDKGMRSAKWKCASNNGYTIEVCAGWDTKEGAKSHEKFLISCFLDLGHPLVNASKGGDGAVGYHHTDEAVCRIKVAQSGASGFWFGKVGPTKGKVLSDEHRSKLAESKVGDRNPRFGNPITDVHRGRLTFEANRIYICVDCGYKNKAVCMAKHLRATNHTGGNRAMNTTMLKRARRLFTNELAPKKICRHNIRAWVAAVRYLGDKWLLAPRG